MSVFIVQYPVLDRSSQWVESAARLLGDGNSNSQSVEGSKKSLKSKLCVSRLFLILCKTLQEIKNQKWLLFSLELSISLSQLTINLSEHLSTEHS